MIQREKGIKESISFLQPGQEIVKKTSRMKTKQKDKKRKGKHLKLVSSIYRHCHVSLSLMKFSSQGGCHAKE